MLLLLAVSAPAVFAVPPGLNLGWEACGPAGQTMRTFACDRNDGTNTLVGSVVPPFTFDRTIGIDAGVIVGFPNGPVPSWRLMVNPGSCRHSSLTVNFQPTDAACRDYWSAVGGASGSISFWPGDPGSNGIIVDVHASVDTARAGTIYSGIEYFLFNLVLDNALTVGASSCEGCGQPTVITFRSVWIDYQGGRLGFGYPSRRYAVTWQSSIDICHAVPVQNRTWGELKALYR